MSYLSPDQRRFWQDNGYLVLERFADEAACASLQARAAELVSERQSERNAATFSTTEQAQTSNAYFLGSGDQIRIFMEEGGTGAVNKLGHAMHDLDPVFDAFARQPHLAEIAEGIGFQSPGLLQSMYIFKHPRVGGEVSAHQDSAFLYTDPLSVVGFWFAIDDATVENACLWALPGGHREPLRRRFHRDGQGGVEFTTLDARPLPTEGYVPLEVPRGTLVLLHGQLPHYSEANRSEKAREAFTVHVIAQAAAYAADNWLQRGAELELRGFA
ncbi:MAG: phytanoyl-CoA dioxygenase family protein [Bacteroidota bacterium]